MLTNGNEHKTFNCIGKNFKFHHDWRVQTCFSNFVLPTHEEPEQLCNTVWIPYYKYKKNSWINKKTFFQFRFVGTPDVEHAGKNKNRINQSITPFLKKVNNKLRHYSLTSWVWSRWSRACPAVWRDCWGWWTLWGWYRDYSARQDSSSAPLPRALQLASYCIILHAIYLKKI